MTELGTALAAALLALGMAAWSARFLFGRSPSPRRDSPRLAQSRAASASLASPSLRALAALTLLVAFLAFIAFAVVHTRSAADPAASSLELALWASLPFVLGVAVSHAVSRLAFWTASRAVVSISPYARSAPSAALSHVVSASTLATLLPAVIAFVLLLALCALTFGLSGAFAHGASPALIASSRTSVLVISYAAGTCYGALFQRLVDAGFVATTGASLPLANDASDFVASLTVGASAALLPSSLLANANAERLHSPSAIVFLPLIASAFSLLSAAGASFALRSDGNEDASNPIRRSLLVCAALCIASLFGLSHWLFDQRWVGPFASGAAGLAVALLAFFAEHTLAARTADVPVRGVVQRAEVSSVAASLALGSSLQRAALFGLLGLLCVLAGATLSSIGGLEQASAWGAAFAILGFLAPAPFFALVSGIGTLAALAQGSSQQQHLAARSDAFERIARDCWRVGGPASACRGYASSTSALSGVIGVLCYVAAASSYAPAQPAASSFGLQSIVVAASGFVGVVVIIFFAGHVAKAAASLGLGRDTQSLVDRANGGEGEGDDAAARPRQGRVSAAAQIAVRQGVTSMLIAGGASLAAGAAVQAVGSRVGTLSSSDDVSTMLAAAAVAGGLVALVLDTRTAVATDFWDGGEQKHGERKTSVDVTASSANNPGQGAAVVSDTLGSPAGYMAGSALHSLARLLPVVVVVIAPLLH